MWTEKCHIYGIVCKRTWKSHQHMSSIWSVVCFRQTQNVFFSWQLNIKWRALQNETENENEYLLIQWLWKCWNWTEFWHFVNLMRLRVCMSLCLFVIFSANSKNTQRNNWLNQLWNINKWISWEISWSLFMWHIMLRLDLIFHFYYYQLKHFVCKWIRWIVFWKIFVCLVHLFVLAKPDSARSAL